MLEATSTLPRILAIVPPGERLSVRLLATDPELQQLPQQDRAQWQEIRDYLRSNPAWVASAQIITNEPGDKPEGDAFLWSGGVGLVFERWNCFGLRVQNGCRVKDICAYEASMQKNMAAFLVEESLAGFGALELYSEQVWPGPEPLTVALTLACSVRPQAEIPEGILQFFDYAHLPPERQEVSRRFGELAAHIAATLPRNAERSTALRKLLEAKDAAVRASFYKEPRRPGAVKA